MKKFVLFLIIISLCTIVLTLPAFAEEKSGTSGEVQWKFDSATGVLTVSGTGKMEDYYYSGGSTPIYIRPWRDYQKNIKKIIIEQGVTHIADYAFCHAVNVTEVVLPDSLESIGEGAFYELENLKAIHIPKSVTEIERSAFKGCKNLKFVEIPAGVTVLDGYLFEGCTALSSVVVKGEVTCIGYRAFYACKALKQFDIPDTVTEIEERAFAYSGITSITLPDGLQTMGHMVFQSCDNLKSVVVPASVTSVGETFRNATSLETIRFEGNVLEFPEAFFEKVNATVLYPNNNPTWNKVFRQNYRGTINWVGYESEYIPEPILASGVWRDNITYTLTSDLTLTLSGEGPLPDLTLGTRPLKDLRWMVVRAEIEEGITSVAPYTFYECKNMSELKLPSTITRLDSSLFNYCRSLKSLTIPDNVTEFGAIGGSIQYVYFLGDAPQFDSLAFRDMKATIYYPKGNATWTEEVKQNYYGQLTWKEDCGTTHNEQPLAAVPATCVAGGLTAGTKCADCERIIQAQSETPILAHKHVTDKAKKPSCTASGLTEGSHCGTCNVVLVAQETIEPTGHDYGQWEIIKQPTEEETGLKVRSCANCGDEQQEIIAKLDSTTVPTQITTQTTTTQPITTHPSVSSMPKSTTTPTQSSNTSVSATTVNDAANQTSTQESVDGDVTNIVLLTIAIIGFATLGVVVCLKMMKKQKGK